MAGARQPIALVKAKGAKHLTQAEIEEREASEIKAPVPDKRKITPPKYLPAGLKKKFREIARQLIDLGLISKLDYDVLARYLMAEAAYLVVTAKVNDAITAGELDEADNLSRMQDRYFKQCRANANDLGLTVSSRCRLVVPQVQAPQEDDPNADLFG